MEVRAFAGMSGTRLRCGARPDKRGVVLLTLLSGLCWPALARAEPPELQLPVACTPGKDCFVQNYPDDDTAPGSVRDFACTSATYDGHDGTDIRVLSVEAAKGVKVLAAAAGTVRGTRDGVPDHLMRTAADKAAVNGRECGNGVAIVHADGWETQYCHMRRGSVRVRPGQTVKAGDPLGEVGQSGETQFAHVHLTVRHNGKPIDPFTGKALGDAPSGTAGGTAPFSAAANGGTTPSCLTDATNVTAGSLWPAPVASLLGAPATVVLEAGFVTQMPLDYELEQGHARLTAPTAAAPEFIFFARIMHLRAGDRVHFGVELPEGQALDETAEPMAGNSAVKVLGAGRKRSGPAWPAGSYLGHVEVLRNGHVIAHAAQDLELPEND